MKKIKDMTLQEWCEYKHIDGGGEMVLQILKQLDEEAEEENEKI